MADLVIIGFVQANPGLETTLVAAQAELVHAARTQPGKVVFFERWTDRDAWERHMRGPHMDAFRAKARHLIGGFELMHVRQVA